MKLLEWAPFDQTTYEITAAELRELVLETSVAYMKGCNQSVQQGEWARTSRLGWMIRKLTCRGMGTI